MGIFSMPVPEMTTACQKMSHCDEGSAVITPGLSFRRNMLSIPLDLAGPVVGGKPV